MENENGLVYVLTNSAMPGIVKIGITQRLSMDDRLRELFKTNIPVPFKCEFACEVSDCRGIEQALQIAFGPYRFPKREFFKIEPEQVIAILKKLGRAVMTNEVNSEIEKVTTKEERDAGEKLERQRRPPLNFTEMGIPIGTKLQYTEGDNAIEIEVAGEKKIKYNNEILSLTAVTKKLLELDYAVQPVRFWTFKGKTLKEIYEETYPFEN